MMKIVIKWKNCNEPKIKEALEMDIVKGSELLIQLGGNGHG